MEDALVPRQEKEKNFFEADIRDFVLFAFAKPKREICCRMLSIRLRVATDADPASTICYRMLGRS